MLLDDPNQEFSPLTNSMSSSNSSSPILLSPSTTPTAGGGGGGGGSAAAAAAAAAALMGGSAGAGGPVATTTVLGEPYGPDAPDTKEGIEELCPVCGDKVSGYHYGLLTCESCKGFFKRTVQNKKVYTCVADRSCHIDKSQRKRCPYCRFQKCLDVGMKLEAVRADRMRGGRNKFGPMYKRDRARKLQLMRQKQLASQVRAPGQCVAGSVVPDGAVLGATTVSTIPSYLVSSATGPTTMYSAAGHAMKQELIQIPQLSSSTSSPDSSPLPSVGSSSALPAAIPGTSLGTTHPNGPLSVHHSVVGGPSATRLQSPPPLGAHPPTPHTPNEHKVSWHSVASGSTASTPAGTPTLPATASVPVPVAGSSSSSSHHPHHHPSSHPQPPSHHHPSSTASPKHVFQYDTVALCLSGVTGKVPPLIREFQSSPGTEDKEWQTHIFQLLQSQTYNQCEVDLFELLCKVLDQSLFAQVDWARNSIFFKDLKVDDQMKLLQNAWSNMLVIDHLHQRLHNNLPDEVHLPNGQRFDLLLLAVLGLNTLVPSFTEITAKLHALKFDSVDFLCLKFILLLNPEVRSLSNRKLISDAHDQTKAAMHEYTVNCYPQIQDKYHKVLQLVPEINSLSERGEEYLYYKHLQGGAPTQTLLMEMLHAKKK